MTMIYMMTLKMYLNGNERGNEKDNFFSGVKSIYSEGARLNKNSYAPIKKSTLDALMEMPAIQGELDFFNFLQQRFELQYEKYIRKPILKI